MNRLALLIVFTGMLNGCTSAELNRSLFPAVPEQPDKPKAEEKQLQPVNPNQVSDRNARQALRDLDAELEKDGK